jgi:hypothetical protein
LFFNVGVEAGQLLFVVAVLALAATVKNARKVIGDLASHIPSLQSRIALVSSYAIGAVAMFWVIERMAAF